MHSSVCVIGFFLAYAKKKTNDSVWKLRTATLVSRWLFRVTPINHHTFSILGRLASGCFVKDGFGQFAKGALDVDVRLCRGLHEADVVFAGDLRTRLLEISVRFEHREMVCGTLTDSPRSWLTTRLSDMSHLLPSIIFSTSSLACCGNAKRVRL